jgi:hypothetical protein
MRETEFRTWLADGGQRPPAISRHISDVRRVETHSGDLDAVYQQDRCRGLLAQMVYSRADRQAATPSPTSIVVEGDLFQRWRCNLWKYMIQFRVSGIRVRRPLVARSLVAMTTSQVPVIAWEQRNMTPRECSRPQKYGRVKALTYDKRWGLQSSWQCCKCFGRQGNCWCAHRRRVKVGETKRNSR